MGHLRRLDDMHGLKYLHIAKGAQYKQFLETWLWECCWVAFPSRSNCILSISLLLSLYSRCGPFVVYFFFLPSPSLLSFYLLFDDNTMPCIDTFFLAPTLLAVSFSGSSFCLSSCFWSLNHSPEPQHRSFLPLMTSLRICLQSAFSLFHAHHIVHAERRCWSQFILSGIDIHMIHMREFNEGPRIIGIGISRKRTSKRSQTSGTSLWRTKRCE